MSTRAFLIVAALWAVALWLATTFVGALLGFAEAITVAFFVGPLLTLAHVPETWVPLLGWGLLAAYALWVLTLAGIGLREALRHNGAAARGWWAGAMSLMAIVGVLKISADAMVAGWP